MSDESLLPTDDEIIAAAVQHRREWRQARVRQPGTPETGFPILQHGRPVAWVKFTGEPDSLEEEAYTQDYVYETLHQQPALLDFIRVPEVIRIIRSDDPPYVLVVMEYVHGQTVRYCLERDTTEETRDRYWGQIIGALSTLLNFQPPPNTPPGPAGGGRISHVVFGEYCEPDTAPRDFNSARDFENHINETIAIRGVNFTSEELKLCHCDPHQSNFIIPHEGGSIYMIDFGHCFWLPPSFMSLALFANWRDEIFYYLRENLPELQQLSETNQTALSHFNAENIRRERESRRPPPPTPPTPPPHQGYDPGFDRIKIQVLNLHIT